MKGGKSFVRVLLTVVMLLCAMCFVACGQGNAGDTGKGTYYLYENGQLDKSSFIKLDGGKWSDDDNESGTYSISGDSVTIYIEIDGEKEEFAKGTLKDGVLTLTIMGETVVYCQEGKTPSSPSGIVDDGHSVISSSECEINNKTLTAYIISPDGNYDLRDKFKVSDGASWRAFTSADCSPVTELTMRAMTVEYGWNDVYVMVENQTTYERSTYNLRVYRAPVSSVTLLDDGTYCVDKGVDFPELIIPSKYNGKKITKIGNSAFEDCKSLANITIPDSVIVIDKNAFKNCSVLTSVTIGKGVTKIGDSAFYGCNGIENIYIADIAVWCNIDGLVSLMGGGYNYNKKLYLNNKLITDLVIPDGVVSIGDSSFGEYSRLTSVTIPSSVTSIGKWAFCGCTGLTSVTIPGSVTSIGTGAFSGCSGLNTLSLQNGVTEIMQSAFSDCSGLTSITIPNSVTYISTYVFQNCYKLVEVINNSSLNITKGRSDNGSVAYYALNVKNGGSSDIVNQNGYLFYTDNGKNYLLGYVGNATDLELPENYNGNSYEIYEYAFYGCSGVASITIPDSVTSIGSSAFENCYKLVEVINNSSLNITKGSSDNGYVAGYALNVKNGGSSDVVSRNDYLFYTDNGTNYLLGYVGNATDLELPANYNGNSYEIYEYAFYGCGLTSITIPNSVTSIGSSAFEHCGGLNIHITDMAAWCNMDGLYNLMELGWYGVGRRLYLNNELITNLVIPDGVTTIGEYAFSGYSNLTSITIPESVTSIGESAFYKCIGLKSVTIGNGTIKIGDSAFKKCTGLTTVKIGNGVTYIGESAFEDCSGLTSVTIGDGVTKIGDSAFKKCTGLTSVTIPDSVTSVGALAFYGCTELASVTIGNNVTFIGYYAFKGCSGLENIYITNVGAWCKISGLSNLMQYGSSSKKLYLNNELITDLVIPNSVTSIESYAFSGCTELTSVTIPNSVIKIGESAFEGCTGLTSIIIPNSVIKIGEYAFSDCTGLTSVTISNRVTKIEDYTFSGCTGLMSITIPDGVTKIGVSAFGDCTALTSATIPNSVTSIAKRAFENCTRLTKIHFNGTITQWNAITKGSDWNNNTGSYTVNCQTKSNT